MGSKNSLEKLFIAQKKGVRALMPGYVRYYYDTKNNVLPQHTKNYFKSLEISTVHTVILINLMIFIHKINELPHLLPGSIVDICQYNKLDQLKYILTPEQISNNCDVHRLKTSRNSLFEKAKYLYPTVLQDYWDKHGDTKPLLTSANKVHFKRSIKRYLLEIRASENSQEWEPTNFRLHEGFRRSQRMGTTHETACMTD